MLDGLEISKSDRIKALQNFKKIHKIIIEKQTEYLEKRVIILNFCIYLAKSKYLYFIFTIVNAKTRI